MPVGLGDGSPARSSVNVVQMEKTTSGPSQAIPLSETIENAHTKSAAVVLAVHVDPLILQQHFNNVE